MKNQSIIDFARRKGGLAKEQVAQFLQSSNNKSTKPAKALTVERVFNQLSRKGLSR